MKLKPEAISLQPLNLKRVYVPGEVEQCAYDDAELDHAWPLKQ